ncbi:sugar ABC transporter ATP-binding protein [Chakrabartyella piscis]|uniref:sugar ABC transporter ATP-binding protein n=1 Tax=Chakrabartyella piscis TaxID=2918914 RepID=UPI002958BB3B|nr:sugar ABC transporter ATP-binding protein [Chakrabartyella piscis]
MSECVLQMKKVTKEFPGVKALSDVDFNIYKGECMALIGENGAGKSTLMKVLSGVYPKYEGEIVFRGKKVAFDTPRQANEAGIAIIHQELNMISYMKIYENIFLGREIKTKFGKLDKKAMVQKAKELMDEMEIDLDPNEEVCNLSLAKQQMVEIAKALSMNADIIVMDEPTDALPESDVKNLFRIINGLRGKDIGVVYISHKLGEVFEICDRITVLRDGQFIAENKVEELDEDALIKLMVGRTLEEQFPHVEYGESETVFEVKNLSNQYIHDVSFSAKKGEIIGVSGLVGAGRTELAKTIYGAYRAESGQIFLNGKEIKSNSPKEAISNGIYYISEDRKGDGLILDLDIKSNITISCIEKLTKNTIIQKKKELEVCGGYRDKLNIKTPSIHQKIKNLSGGNQQKVAIAKGLITDPQVLLIDEPTRGVDVGAKKEIYDLINLFKMQGKTIILISSEMPEILGMSDKVLVMHEGTIKGEVDRKDATGEVILELIFAKRG